jgi:glycosyltransferase involved in cell wall biosynthesis
VALRSVLSQKDVDLEAVVVDEASTDDTVETVHAFEDERVRLVRHEHPLGVGASRNHGAAEARGEWLAFLDDDDLWAPTKLARQLEGSRLEGRSWSYTWSVNVDEGLRVIRVVRPPAPLEVVALIGRRNVIPGGGSNVIVRRDAFESVGPFDTRLKNTEDWEMWIRLATRGLPSWVPDPLLAYRVHQANASLDIGAIFEGVSLIERRHGTRVDRGVLHRWIGESCLRMGQRSRALRHMTLALMNGEVRGVGEDVARLVARRIRRRFRPRNDPPSRNSREWVQRAQLWVDELAHE